jgi:arylsulfatase
VDSTNSLDTLKLTRIVSGAPELNYTEGEFYATDVFTDYALEFLDQARRQEDTPWFLYLAHSSPHFPVQAPAELTDKYMATYRRGWDDLRSERLERMKAMRLVSANTELPPLAMVPVDQNDIANGYSGQPNPAWDSLSANRREDLARRMAIVELPYEWDLDGQDLSKGTRRSQSEA